MPLTLYKLDASPPVRAVYMVIEAINLPDVELKDVKLFEGEHLTEEYLKMNPQHTIPLLKDDDFYIWDSHAICAYLIGKYAQDDSLYPADLKKRAVIDQRLHFDSGILFPSLRGAAAPVLFGGEKSFRQENLDKINAAYELTEKFLPSPWLAGDNLTLADICCVSSISSMNEILPIDQKLYPNIADWMKRCSKLEFYKKGNVSGLQQIRDLFKSKLA